MSKEDLELDDDFIDEDTDEGIDESEVSATSSKSSLTKRRIIDSLLEERRLSKELADYDYDLD